MSNGALVSDVLPEMGFSVARTLFRMSRTPSPSTTDQYGSDQLLRHSLPVLLPSVRTLVAEVHDSGSKRACFDQLEIDRTVQVREEWGAVAEDERMHQEPVFIDQVEAHEGCGEIGATEAKITSG